MMSHPIKSFDRVYTVGDAFSELLPKHSEGLGCRSQYKRHKSGGYSRAPFLKILSHMSSGLATTETFDGLSGLSSRSESVNESSRYLKSEYSHHLLESLTHRLVRRTSHIEIQFTCYLLHTIKG